MRLDHLLSKETSADASVCCNILRSGSEAELMIFSLFNLEGIPQKVKIGCGGLAQLGEHLLCKQGVIGSIPFISTRTEMSKRIRVQGAGQPPLIQDMGL